MIQVVNLQMYIGRHTPITLRPHFKKKNQSIVLAAKLREAPYRFSAQGGNGTKVPVEQGFLNCSSAKLNHNEGTITSPQ